MYYFLLYLSFEKYIIFFFILFYFILFYFILFYFISFILFYFILFYFILFYFMLLFYFILFYFILFYFILENRMEEDESSQFAEGCTQGDLETIQRLISRVDRKTQDVFIFPFSVLFSFISIHFFNT